jgi:hypothetical protein
MVFGGLGTEKRMGKFIEAILRVELGKFAGRCSSIDML